MKIRTLAELGAIDPICQRFTPLGLGITRMLTLEAAADYHQRTVDVELTETVVESTRKSFERLQRTHVMGILDYELFSVAESYSLLVLEQAFAERLVAYYGGRIPLIDRDGNIDYLENVTIFDQVVLVYRPAVLMVSAGSSRPASRAALCQALAASSQRMPGVD